ncbi:MAG: hypothetical protein MUP27_09185 [Desulfobacterales bacterium]|nr:hypothetical protein [Desulfobacterales bacterium]
MAKKLKTQSLELEVNELMAETLVQCLRHPNGEAISALKENLSGVDEAAFDQAREKLEEEIVDQITWGLFGGGK